MLTATGVRRVKPSGTSRPESTSALARDLENFHGVHVARGVQAGCRTVAAGLSVEGLGGIGMKWRK